LAYMMTLMNYMTSICTVP